MADTVPTPSAPATGATAPSAPAPTAAPDPKPNGKRKRALLGVAAVALLGGLAYGAYWFVALRHFETTDNAYVQGNIVQITPQVAGTVVSVGADDTDFVKAGQLLVRLDDADARVALAQAEAQLAQAVRQTRTLFVANGTFRAQIASRTADLARARADLARAEDDVRRRQPLVATGAVGQEEFDHAKAQVAVARTALSAAESGETAAREQLASNQALTEGTPVEQHPAVLAAAARVREALLQLKRTELVAPVDGTVARRSVQIGQRVAAGAPLMAVIALGDVWVDANFKESQLRNLRLGQPVTLAADVYGGKVEYHGRVEGLGAGTGAAFALLPAQNATGNWIKVVQRVPVRIALDPKELASHPLRVGLSMEATVDIADTGGRMVADTATQASKAPRAEPGAADDTARREADASVQRIIAANLGRPATALR